jgi:hypothetical protein
LSDRPLGRLHRGHRPGRVERPLAIDGGIGRGMPEIPDNPMFNLKPNALISGLRYYRMMEAV